MSDVIKVLAEGFYAAHGGKLNLARLYDQIYGEQVVETRSEAEIVEDVKKKLLAGGEA